MDCRICSTKRRIRMISWEMEPFSNAATVEQIRSIRMRIDNLGVMDPVQSDCDSCVKFEQEVLGCLKSLSDSFSE